ncbi:MAG: hypothetical protein CL840_13000 [Crocinitomicaceae bacterium]|nr:hypothetical protein [Crocinitomicaceae bacterium]|tara:strand:- start:14202 stop:15452 length:1251 start_codon:yes stop_codon:yes gene_type:complete
MKNPKTRHYILTILLAFLLPVYQKGVPIIIVLLLVNWISLGRKALHLSDLKSNITLQLLLAFYLWHVLGLLWSNNLDFGLFDLEIKSSFLLLPMVFAAFGRFKVRRFERVLKVYLLGCGTAIFVGVINSIWSYKFGEGQFLDFYDHNITPILHISYFAMYLNLGLVICFYLIIRNETNFYSWRNISLIVLSFVFALATFLSTSRNGFLALIFILLIVSAYAIIRYRKWLLGISIVLIMWIVASSFLKDINSGKASFHGLDQIGKVMNREEVDKDEGESTAVRVLIWTSTWNLIKENPILGVGTGDIKDGLMDDYKLSQYSEPYRKNYNSHNQYLQSFAALGIIGLLLLLSMFAYPAFVALQKTNYLYLMFIINVAVSCLTESILEVQAGVVFFVFFSVLFAPILNASESRKLSFKT